MGELISLKDMKFPKGCPKVEFYREPEYCEIVLYLFERCNLRCEFCFQEHEHAQINCDYIKHLPEAAFQLMSKELRAHPTIKSFDIRMLGGEIFADDLPNELFDLYGEVVEKIREEMKTYYPDVNVDFICTTNGVWKERERVKKFLEKYSFKKILSVSVDFIGRYKSDKVKQIAYDTMKFFGEAEFYVRAGVVLTKRNIQYILKHPKEFKNLIRKYKAEQIVFNYYSPNEQWKLDLPSDEDLWQIYKFCFDERMFNVSTIFYLIEAYRQQKFFTKTCECKFIPTLTETKCTKDCVTTASTLPMERFYGEFTKEITEENVSDVKASLGIVKRGCLGCDHYEYCPQPCWCMVIFDGYEAVNCPMKRAFKYIKDNPQIMQDYENWMNKETNFN